VRVIRCFCTYFKNCNSFTRKFKDWHASSITATWSRVLLENLTGLQLVKKFPAFYGTRRFITAFTSARHLFLSLTLALQNVLIFLLQKGFVCTFCVPVVWAMESRSILSKPGVRSFFLIVIEACKDCVIQHHRVVRELLHIFLAAFCRLQLTHIIYHIIYSARLQNPYGYENSQYCT